MKIQSKEFSYTICSLKLSKGDPKTEVDNVSCLSPVASFANYDNKVAKKLTKFAHLNRQYNHGMNLLDFKNSLKIIDINTLLLGCFQEGVQFSSKEEIRYRVEFNKSCR